MILASFDAEKSREAAISGAYQYDTGQRIRMTGLPTPGMLGEADEFLSGEQVTVQAQFSYRGDAQSEPRLAQYEEETETWLVDVPDAYLTRAEAVHVYVYVMYGADEERSRAKTMYEGAFTPISRPAPNTAVTPDQLNAWDVLVAEVNLTLSQVDTAISEANAAAQSADAAAETAQSAADAANEAAAAAQESADAWNNATASAQTLAPGSGATVTLGENAQGGKHLTYGIPQGEKGEKGDTGPAGVTFTLSGTTLYITTD